MKKIIKLLLGLLALLCIGAALMGIYVKSFLPNVGDAEELIVASTPERVKRGEYLANHVTVCMDCHSTRNWSQYAGPISGNLGGGGEKFDHSMGFPGRIFASNITPFNLSNWTDGELYRAITTGVNKDDKALFPVMPYHNYGRMDREDIMSIIAYLRTLKPIEYTAEERQLDFPLNFIVNTIPTKAQPTTKPNESDILAYGGYLVNAAGCVDCHSKTEKGAIIPGSEFGGGMEFHQLNGVVRSPNITSDKATGIGNWSKEFFVQRFKMYQDSSYVSPVLTPNDLNTPMPWTMYAGMKESDLEAMFAYLQSLQPISNSVNRFEKK